MKICFLVELPKGMWQWRDGLRAALELLDHSICYHLDGLLGDHKPDVLFAWGGSFAPTTETARKYSGKSILFFAGGGIEPKYFEGIDVVCFENELHTQEARMKGIKCLTAFGTDTQTFKPMKQPKVFDVIYPGAFGLWKRKDLFAQATKNLRAFTLGNIQPHEMQCFDVCVDNGVAVSADIPQENLPYFYAMSKTVCVLPVPEIGGQRTVLEAMAMKLPTIVPVDAPLVVEYAKHGGIIVETHPEEIKWAIESQLHSVNQEGYEYVMDNLTEKHYAKKIRTALEML